ncbi:chitin deacetylase [Entomortierella chlamydospora]|uniref:Chitin deacetylase n=1 Tax=Entomortierella chlamydospora TaxID=101097 RepID=A0A9P6SZ83_9FUNG|nr:chitin deacetylase [Entomortierella chlamydospora]KAG0013065.1 chitin deacetylase [Entomortierella chlamydospora]
MPTFFDKYVSESDHQKAANHALQKLNLDGIITSRTIPNILAIIFDDGPFEYTEKLFDFLKEESTRVTFFLNGESRGDIHEFGNAVRRAYEEGHQIGLHAWNHADLTTLSEDEIREEMSWNIIGVRPVYMRPSCGYVDDRSEGYLHKNGYKIVNWSTDTNDWRHPDDVEASMKAYESALTRSDAHKNGYIALQHNTIESTAENLAPVVARYAKENGFKV